MFFLILSLDGIFLPVYCRYILKAYTGAGNECPYDSRNECPYMVSHEGRRDGGLSRIFRGVKNENSLFTLFKHEIGGKGLALLGLK